jgi:hypothetical protein
MKVVMAKFRHRLAAAALAFALAGIAPSFAQAPAAVAPALSASHVQAAREVLELTGITQTFEQVFTEFRDNTRQLVTTTRPEMLKDMEEVVASLKPEVDKRREDITLGATEVFAKRFTEADLKEIAVFFRSPVGQRYQSLRNTALEDVFKLLTPWSLQTSNMLFDRFAEEMRKRGHKL